MGTSTVLFTLTARGGGVQRERMVVWVKTLTVHLMLAKCTVAIECWANESTVSRGGFSIVSQFCVFLHDFCWWELRVFKFAEKQTSRGCINSFLNVDQWSWVFNMIFRQNLDDGLSIDFLADTAAKLVHWVACVHSCSESARDAVYTICKLDNSPSQVPSSQRCCTEEPWH